VSADCVVTNLQVTYWAGWMDVGRINVSADRGEGCTCAEIESIVAVRVFTVSLCFIISTHTHTEQARCFRIKILEH